MWLNRLTGVIIMSAYDKVGILTFDTVENTIITNRMYDERYIMGCINSDFISWYAYLFIYNKAIRTMVLIAIIWERFLSPVSLPT